MKMVKLTINNKPVEVEHGTYLLQAARQIGIKIPTLCYHPALEPYGACRVCLVEVTRESWQGWSRLVVSCAYPVEDGLIVMTDSARVVKARQFVFELLLARCPKSEILKKMAAEYGVTQTRFKIPENVVEEAKNCILCGLCVRVCTEIIKKSAISFVSRGGNRSVKPPFDKPSETCITCGACAFVCPTGAISVDDILGVRKISVSKQEALLDVCIKCGKKYIPLPLKNHIGESFQLLKEFLNLCPECRRKEQSQKLYINYPVFSGG